MGLEIFVLRNLSYSAAAQKNIQSNFSKIILDDSQLEKRKILLRRKAIPALARTSHQVQSIS